MRRCIGRQGVMAGLAGVAVLIGLPTGGAAQTPSPTGPAVSAPGPADADEGPAALAEEIAVLRAVQPLRLTPEQLQALSAAVKGGHERLTQQSQADLRALAALREAVTRARGQLLARGLAASDPQAAVALQADQPVEAARRTAEQNQRRVQDELVAALQRQLSTLLTPTQIAQVASRGQGMVMTERQAQDWQREQQRQQWQQQVGRAGTAPGMAGRGAGPGGPRGRGGPGGSGEWTQGMLERLRGADTNQYQAMSSRMASRFGDVGTPAYQNARAMLDQVRNMPDAQFRRQRADLGQQFGAAMTAPRSAMSAAASISLENATGTWVRRYLLSPQAPAALQDLSTAKSGG
jgi:hypothetical protein